MRSPRGVSRASAPRAVHAGPMVAFARGLARREPGRRSPTTIFLVPRRFTNPRLATKRVPEASDLLLTKTPIRFCGFRLVMRTTTRIILALLAGTSIAPGTVLLAQGPLPPSRKSIAELVQMLGSPRFQERESATQALANRDEAAPLLRKALNSSSAEVVRRAKVALDGINNRMLRRFVKYGKNGRIDLFVEWVGSAEGVLDQRALWQGVIEIGSELLSRGRPPTLPEKLWATLGKPDDYRTFVDGPRTFLVNPESIDPKANPIFAIRTWKPVSARGIVNSRIICAAPVRIAGNITTSFVFANDDVTCGNYLGGSVIVADGDVLARRASLNMVVARRSVKIETISKHAASSIHAGGRVQLSSTTEDDNLWQERRVETKPYKKDEVTLSVIEERNPRAFNFVRFFELADLGIDGETRGAGVAVRKVQAGTPLAKAGLQVGDVVLAVDGNETKDCDRLRRQMRKAFVGQQGKLTVRRGDKSLDLIVSFYGFELPK